MASSVAPVPIDGGWNWLRYYNKELDDRAGITEWKGEFDDVLKAVVRASIFNAKRFTFLSDRLNGDLALFTDPVHVPVNCEFIFAKDAQQDRQRQASQRAHPSAGAGRLCKSMYDPFNLEPARKVHRTGCPARNGV
jgi:hypothetical protein